MEQLSFLFNEAEVYADHEAKRLLRKVFWLPPTSATSNTSTQWIRFQRVCRLRKLNTACLRKNLYVLSAAELWLRLVKKSAIA